MGYLITANNEPEQVTITRVTSEAVSKGAVLTYTDAFDATADPKVMTVENIDTSEKLRRAVGVALDDAASGDTVRIVVSGEAQVLLDGTTNDIAIGDPLIASATVAGVLIEQATPAAGEEYGIIVPLMAQATDLTTGTLTWCSVNCR